MQRSSLSVSKLSKPSNGANTPSAGAWSRCRAWLSGFVAEPAELSNRLSQPGPERVALPPARMLLAALVLVALVPRLVMAWKLDVLCVDGTLYVKLAQALEQGDLTRALHLQLNIYPAIMAVLHRLGLSWELASESWGVLVSTLTVLPLFGWVRRQFNDRVATIACLLYAVHPELIEWSPEMVRDPTFWFLVPLALYTSWRAVTEISLFYFLLTGVCIALAALTRFEGLFVIIALSGWTVLRYRALAAGRAKLVSGYLVGLFGLPLLLLAVNLTVLGHRNHWESFRLEPLVRVQHWLASFARPAPGPVPALAVAAAEHDAPVLNGAANQQWTTGRLVWQFVHLLERGYTPLFGLLFLAGYAVWHKTFNRRDHLPLAATSVAVCVGIWIHLWYTHTASSRYALTIVVLSTPCAALGLLSALSALARLLERRAVQRPRVGLIAAALVLVLVVVSIADAMTSRFNSRLISADLGRWMLAKYGRDRLVAGTDDQLPLISHYAGGGYAELPPHVSAADMLHLLENQQPSAVVFPQRQSNSEAYRAVVHDQERLGLEMISPFMRPAGNGKIVFARVRAVQR